ncbi:MAG: aminotransferase class V-fold PLP-dependent enzyme [Gammaproteobacteria bacterium]|nr:aminotransferase class V-fold PLP-dependent enzyme [Gammaproteobacteria bacterium]
MRDPAVIYLDHAATTPVDPRAIAPLLECLGPDGDYATASSAHAPGGAARRRVESARVAAARLVGATPADVYFTSGATESDNLAILGLVRAVRGARHVVTTRIEHRAVLDACARLESEGVAVTYVEPAVDGRVPPERIAAALRPATLLVSVMHANNETGVVNDIGAIGALCRARGVAFHVDAAQSAGKLAIDVRAQGIDLLAVAAHKMYGPKGVGLLYVDPARRAQLQPQSYGGGQERGLRSGTLAVHQIAGFGAACEIALTEMAEEAQRLVRLRERLWGALQALPGVLLNGHATERLPGTLNVAFAGVEGESLLYALPGLAVSSGSACHSHSAEPSYVLRALGRDPEAAQASLRFSLGRWTSEADIDQAAAAVVRAVSRLRSVAP